MPTNIDLKFRELLRLHDNTPNKEKLCEAWIDFFFVTQSVATPAMLEATKSYIHELLKDNTGSQLSVTSEEFLVKMANQGKLFYLCYVSTHHKELPRLIREIFKKKHLDSTVFYSQCADFYMSVESSASPQMLEIIKIYMHELMQENQTTIFPFDSVKLITEMVQQKKLNELSLLLQLRREQPLNKDILISAANLLLDEFKRSSYPITLLYQLLRHAISVPLIKELSVSLQRLISHLDAKINRLNTRDASIIDKQRLRTPFRIIPKDLFDAICETSTSTCSELQKSLLHDFAHMLLKQAIVSHSLDHVSAYYFPWINTFFTETHMAFLRLASQEFSSSIVQKDITRSVYALLLSEQFKLAIQVSNPSLILTLLTGSDRDILEHFFAQLALSHEETNYLSKLILNLIQIQKKLKGTCGEHRVSPIQNSKFADDARTFLSNRLRSISSEIDRLESIAFRMGLQMTNPFILKALPTDYLQDVLYENKTSSFPPAYFDLTFLVLFSQIQEQKTEMTYEELCLLIPDALSPLSYAVHFKYHFQNKFQIPFVTENSHAFFEMFFLKGLLAIIEAQDAHALSVLFVSISDTKDMEAFITKIVEVLSTEQMHAFKKLLHTTFENQKANQDDAVGLKQLNFIIGTVAFMTKDPALLTQLPLTKIMKGLENCSNILNSSYQKPAIVKKFNLLFLAIYAISHKKKDIKTQSELEALIPTNLYGSVKEYLLYLKESLGRLPQTAFTESCLALLESKLRVCDPAPRLLPRYRERMFEQSSHLPGSVGAILPTKSATI